MISLLLSAALAMQPCEVREVAARCGTITVPENRAGGEGRSIDLNVVVVPAAEEHEDALFILAGGPGVGATAMTSFASRTFGPAGRDIVMIDARGTGRSHPLFCERPADVQGYFTDLWAPTRIRSCHDRLAADADLTRYTTSAVAEDLETARKRLGYDTVTLYGTSYGTRVAQEYMRRYPRSIRGVILDGVIPPSFAMPATYAAKAQRSLERVFDLCRGDEPCRKAFPDLDADFTAMLKDAEDGITVSIEDPETKKPVNVEISRGNFGEILRNFLYSPEQYARLPFVVHSAAKGDWTPFGEMAMRYARNARSLNLGFFLSVTCTEDLPRVNAEQERERAAGTLLGSYRLDQQLGACRIWPRKAAPASLTVPVVSSTPTLIVSGELDPVTPPEHGDEVARTLKRSLHLVVPHGSHSGDTGGCQEKVMVEFIRKASVEDLDTRCVKNIARPAFRLK